MCFLLVLRKWKSELRFQWETIQSRRRNRKRKGEKIIKSQKHEFSKRTNISSQCRIPCMTRAKSIFCCFDGCLTTTATKKKTKRKMLLCRDECQSNLSKLNLTTVYIGERERICSSPIEISV